MKRLDWSDVPMPGEPARDITLTPMPALSSRAELMLIHQGHLSGREVIAARVGRLPMLLEPSVDWAWQQTTELPVIASEDEDNPNGSAIRGIVYAALATAPFWATVLAVGLWWTR